MNKDGKSINGWLYGPGRDDVLLMMEELGMSILHTGVPGGTEGNSQMFPDNLTSSKAGAGSKPYGVDFWVFDIRVILDINDAFAQKWPHPAVTAGQFYSFDSYVHSYENGAKILVDASAKLKDAQKLDNTITCTVCEPHATTCTDVEVISSEVHRSTGLGVTEYACYNPVEYSWCPAPVQPKKGADPLESTAAFAALGLMLAVLA